MNISRIAEKHHYYKHGEHERELDTCQVGKKENSSDQGICSWVQQKKSQMLKHCGGILQSL